jgi:glycosyltransferase involved in cell wall biosynthesis
VVVTVCRLFPAKGPARLIEAIARVHRMNPQVRLLVVGHEMYAGYAEELEALTRTLGIEHIVTFAGRRGDVPALLAASDVFAMPSFLEPFGLVYAEAMAMELPVVALDNGGTPEVVEHGVSGLLSATDDEGARREPAALVADPPRDELGRRGRQQSSRNSRCSAKLLGVRLLSAVGVRGSGSHNERKGWSVVSDVRQSIFPS